MWLIVKPNLIDEATALFKDSGIKITAEGKKHLGAAIGSEDYKNEFMNEKIKSWVTEIINLTEIAKKDPHSAYCAFTHGLTLFGMGYYAGRMKLTSIIKYHKNFRMTSSVCR